MKNLDEPETHPRESLRLRLIGAMIGGMLIGTLLVSPASAHVGGTVTHLWTKHIKPLTKQLFYTKSQSNSRYYTKSQSNFRYFTKLESDTRFYIKAQADSRFLGNVVTMVSTRDVTAGSAFTLIRTCPAGYTAIGGGVDPENITNMLVAASGPTVGSVRLNALPTGENPPSNGWVGTVQNNGGITQEMAVAVICALDP